MTDDTWKDKYEALAKQVAAYKQALQQRDAEIAKLRTVAVRLSTELKKLRNQPSADAPPQETATSPDLGSQPPQRAGSSRKSLFSKPGRGSDSAVEQPETTAEPLAPTAAKVDKKADVPETPLPKADAAPAADPLPEPELVAPAEADESQAPESADEMTPEPEPEESPEELPPDPTPVFVPNVVTPPEYTVGQFLAAVLDGEPDAEEMKELLAQLDQATDETRFPVLQRIATLYRIMANTMLERADFDGMSWEKRMFLRYGMLDDKLMDDRLDVWNALLSDHSEPGDTGVYFVDEWAEAVYKGELKFSAIDEIALQGVKPDHSATGDKALGYEIVSLAQMQRMCVGPRGIKVPILMQEFCYPGPDNPVVNREWLLPALDYCKKCDKTLFQRTYKQEQVQVKPLFIISPGYGEKGACWEPYSPGKKGTTGPRICLSATPYRSSMNALVMGLAEYRWAYAKQDARQYWMTEGLTGDWMSLFKTKEMREDLSGRFIHSYILWVTKEAHRVPKLEKKFREFFWRVTPFSEEIKEGLKGCAVFNHMFELDQVLKQREEADRKAIAKAKARASGQPIPR